MKDGKKENLVEEDIDLGRFFKLATTNKIYVNGLNLHQTKSEFLEDCTGDFELIGSILIGEIEQKTGSRFKNTDDFEVYNNCIDNGGYDSEEVIFTGWLYKLNTPDLKIVDRSQYGKGTDFRQDIGKYKGNKCYISSSGIYIFKVYYFFH